MKSPGHRKWPDHKVAERHVDREVKVEIGGEVVAGSRDVIRVEEDESPARHYFPRSDVLMDKLEPAELTLRAGVGASGDAPLQPMRVTWLATARHSSPNLIHTSVKRNSLLMCCPFTRALIVLCPVITAESP
jgi:hypothetical protein